MGYHLGYYHRRRQPPPAPLIYYRKHDSLLRYEPESYSTILTFRKFKFIATLLKNIFTNTVIVKKEAMFNLLQTKL